MANKTPMTNDQRMGQKASRWSVVIEHWSLIGHWGLVIGISFLGVSCLSGCIGKPNQANVELRKQNQDLQNQIATLRHERDTARAEVAGLRSHATTVPTLAPDRLAKLFTTSGIELGRLTGGADLDPDRPGDEGLKVYVTPLDNSHQKFKAAGSIVVEAFDLAADAASARVGHWEFSTEEAAKYWSGALLRYEYVVPCPFEKAPSHADLTVKVTFTDELTSRTFTQQRVVKVRLTDQ
jgi:outer membrane murein-binding lipoprotein Lpp